MKNNIKLICLLITIVSFQTCNQYEEIQKLNVENPQNKIGKTALQDDEIASFLISNLQDVTSSGRFSGASETAFDSAIFHLDAESGFKNYAFLLSGDNVEKIANLVFVQTDTAYIGYETIYEPTAEHLNNIQGGSIMVNFTGAMSYRSIQTGEVFLTVQYENGIPLPPETASNGRLPLSDGCYPDEAGRIECYTVYVTTTGDGGYTSSTTGINYNNHTFDEPDSPHTDVYNSCMVIDADFSSCYHTFFNTNGMTSYPQYYTGSSQGTLASTSLGPVYEPVNLYKFLGDRWEANNITLSDEFQNDPCALDVWNKMTENNTMYSILSEFINGSFGLMLEYEMDIQQFPCGRAQNACTDHKREDNKIPTYFRRAYLRGASPASLARTMLHEAIHAHLIYYLKVVERVDSKNWEDFPTLWGYMEEHNHIMKYASHDLMADGYREIIKIGLRDFDVMNGSTHDNEFYDAMSWAGLYETEQYQSLSSTQRQDYEKIISQEENIGGCP